MSNHTCCYLGQSSLLLMCYPMMQQVLTWVTGMLAGLHSEACPLTRMPLPHSPALCPE
jgi:hypothetical protein